MRPNAQEIAEALDVTPEYAAKIVESMNGRAVALDVANAATRAHGVECMRSHDLDDQFYGDIAMLYVNMGDMYATTLIFDVATRDYALIDYAAWMQRYEESGKGELHA